MIYAEAIEHLRQLGPELPTSTSEPSSPRRKFDLAHMRRLCAALADPQDRVPSVLIAGTNGKGSTAATLAGILTGAGYQAGLYTSPHLVRVNERIQLAHPTFPSEYGATISAGAAPGADGPLALSEIPDETFARLYTKVDDTANQLVSSGDLPHPPSFFERLTAVAFLFFAELRAEIMILEVGLGGRLDATNIVQPLLSIISDIALDHQEYLGSTIAEISAEKCGILRPGGTLVTLPQLPEANQAIGLAATALKVHAINAARFVPPPTRVVQGPLEGTRPAHVGVPAEPVTADSKDPQDRHPGSDAGPVQPPKLITLPNNRYTVDLEDGSTLTVDSPLPGQHQQRNIALAIAAAIELRSPSQGAILRGKPFILPTSAIEAGIRTTHWPGRLEFLPPNLLLDVAHNPAGAWALRAALASLPAQQPRTLIFSCLRDKSLAEMSRILFPLFDSSPDGDPERRHDHILLAPISSPRAALVEDLLAAAHQLGCPAHAAPHLEAALAQACEITPSNGLIVATGSVFLVGEVRQAFSSSRSLPSSFT